MGFLSSLFGGKKEKTPEELEQEKEKNFDILKFDGVKAQRMNQLGYAVKCFTGALALKEDYTTRMYLAQSYMMLHEFELAKEQLQIMVGNKPEDIDAFILMARAAEQLEDWHAMNDACQKAFALDENRADVHYLFGKACFGLGDMISAIAMLTKSVTFDESYQPAYTLRCEVLMQMGQWKEAEEDADKLIELNPENESYLLYKAYCLQGLGKTDDALTYYNKVITLNAFCLQAYLAEGNLLMQSGQLEKALTLYTEAIDINPQFSEAYKERGNVKMQLGDKAGAAEDLKKALELAPQEAEQINGEFSNIEDEVNAKMKSINPFY